MYRNFQQEAFSRAYIHAVAAAAGFKYSDGPLPDDDHVDVTVTSTGPMGLIRSPKVDIQPSAAWDRLTVIQSRTHSM